MQKGQKIFAVRVKTKMKFCCQGSGLSFTDATLGSRGRTHARSFAGTAPWTPKVFLLEIGYALVFESTSPRFWRAVVLPLRPCLTSFGMQPGLELPTEDRLRVACGEGPLIVSKNLVSA